MRILLALILLSLPAQAAHVIFNFEDYTTEPHWVRRFVLYPVGQFTNGAGAMITRDWVSRNTGTNGSTTISNVYGWTYRGEFYGRNIVTTNYFTFPVTNGLINASHYVGSATNQPGLGYTMQGADLRFVNVTGDGMTAGGLTNNSDGFWYNGELITAGGASTTNSLRVYVDPSGSDSTGTRGLRSKAFRTLAGAITVVQSGDTVQVSAGTYVGTNLSVNGVTWIFDQNSIINTTNRVVFYDQGVACTNYVRGGRWYHNGSAFAFADISAQSLLVIDCEQIESTSTSGMFVLADGHVFVRASRFLNASEYDIVSPGIGDWDSLYIESPLIRAKDSILETGAAGITHLIAMRAESQGEQNWVMFCNSNTVAQVGELVMTSGKLGGNGGIIDADTITSYSTNTFGIQSGLCSSYGVLTIKNARINLSTNSFGLLNCASAHYVFQNCDIVSTHATPFGLAGSTVTYLATRTNGVLASTAEFSGTEIQLNGDSGADPILTINDTDETFAAGAKVISLVNGLLGEVLSVSSAGEVVNVGGFTSSDDFTATTGGTFIGSGGGLSNAVDLIPGSNVTITTNANKRSFTIASTGGGGSPGGSDSYVQYNNGGAFGGEATFAWDDVNDLLTVTGGGINSGIVTDKILQGNHITSTTDVIAGADVAATGTVSGADVTSSDDTTVGDALTVGGAQTNTALAGSGVRYVQVLSDGAFRAVNATNAVGASGMTTNYNGLQFSNGSLTNVTVKIYRALITQSGVGAPSATVLENTLGGTVVWAYSDVGRYTATLSSAFTANKTFLLLSLASTGESPSKAHALHTSADVISVNSGDGGNYADDLIPAGSCIQILVYP